MALACLLCTAVKITPCNVSLCLSALMETGDAILDPESGRWTRKSF